jgi:hypothetical protein
MKTKLLWNMALLVFCFVFIWLYDQHKFWRQQYIHVPYSVPIRFWYKQKSYLWLAYLSLTSQVEHALNIANIIIIYLVLITSGVVAIAWVQELWIADYFEGGWYEKLLFFGSVSGCTCLILQSRKWVLYVNNYSI